MYNYDENELNFMIMHIKKKKNYLSQVDLKNFITHV